MDLCQVYFTVIIDGKEVHSVENPSPETFTNIRVFAGDNLKPAADASYRNLLWENFHVDDNFDVGTKVQRDKQIGTIDSWGPFFRVSFDLIVHSVPQDRTSSVLDFICETETRTTSYVLSISLNRPWLWLYTMELRFENVNIDFKFDVEKDHWYNIIIEQNSFSGKVMRCL